MDKNSDLLKKKCVPCEKNKGMKPFDKVEAEDYVAELPNDWGLDFDKADPEKFLHAKISKEFNFKDFIGAINFVERVADVAEMEGHHPDIHIYYNKVVLELYTHAIEGLSLNDFILAAKIDAYK